MYSEVTPYITDRKLAHLNSAVIKTNTIEYGANIVISYLLLNASKLLGK